MDCVIKNLTNLNLMRLQTDPECESNHHTQVAIGVHNPARLNKGENFSYLLQIQLNFHYKTSTYWKAVTFKTYSPVGRF